ncbi:hypothetical protein [Algoriphagus sp. NG3]|uniref:hypothetical protein n=1 Tax=Algoriphagus sp. NG3 TaxID=3097546 RepID=UPI002A82FBA5|nr:hypothetical protein [Algoriphagus sp. NG3]WPR77916.1 hypothetical protein SLW71_11215 [Algoriphagus sp. NG3]
MKKTRVKTLVILGGIILLSNFMSGYINLFTEGIITTDLYQSDKAEFEFMTAPAKSRDIKMMESEFNNFKQSNPEYKDLKLYRTFKKKPFEFWNWYAYLTDPKYQYEYQNEIDLKTGKVTSGS